ncbi:MAG: ABC transporter ATP-binding protein [Actinomycetota bacterium]|nr:ABC transporter ATP-binding protein [Actinomycetota bacterium]
MIRSHSLSKTYSSLTALDSVNLDVPDGCVFGLVGPNGAGKSTLLEVLAGLQVPTSGSFEIEVEKNERSLLPDTPHFEPWLTAREVVELSLQLSTGRGDDKRIDEVLEQTGISKSKDRQIGGFSRGMLQRLGLATAVVARPRLIMLDEPASALDPQGRREVLDLVAALRGDATVVFSSHILSDVQEVCDRVAVLNHGKVLFQGPLNELLVGKAIPSITVRLATPETRAIDLLRGQPWVRQVIEVQPGVLLIDTRSTAEAQDHLIPILARANCKVVSITPQEVTLEDAFLELTT